jgi:putative hydrolase of the HAD superfamily
MMPITNIFFDLGNVLVKVDFSRALDQVSARSGLSADELARICQEDPAYTDYETGRMTTAAFFEHLRTVFHFDGTAAELEHLWCDIFSPLDDHVLMMQRLSKYYPVGLISNTSDAHIRFLEAHYPFFPAFRQKIYSHEVGLLKPDPAIYELALERMPGDKYETLFIDDLEANIMTPSRMGWQTIHLRPDVNLREALQSYELRGV